MTSLHQLNFRDLKAVIIVLYYHVLLIKGHHIMLYTTENTKRATLLQIKVLLLTKEIQREPSLKFNLTFFFPNCITFSCILFCHFSLHFWRQDDVTASDITITGHPWRPGIMKTYQFLIRSPEHIDRTVCIFPMRLTH